MDTTTKTPPVFCEIGPSDESSLAQDRQHIYDRQQSLPDSNQNKHFQESSNLSSLLLKLISAPSSSTMRKSSEQQKFDHDDEMMNINDLNDHLEDLNNAAHHQRETTSSSTKSAKQNANNSSASSNQVIQ